MKLSEYIDASRDKVAIYKISDINNMIVSSARAVDHITEPHKIVDCYESDIMIRKENFHVVSGLQMLLTKK